MLQFKEGQTYVCTKANDPWWTEGKEYEVVLDGYNEPIILDDENDPWYSHDADKEDESQFKLKDMQPNVTMKDVKSNTVEHLYTSCDVTKVILKAYQLYNNDAQRLAFIKGYFAK